FIVVGSRGRGAIASSLLGSVSRELTEKATCPLVVVPPNATAPTKDGDAAIVCGVDGSEHALAAARVAGDLAERLGYRVAVVHASRTARSLLSYVGRSTTPSMSVQPDVADRLSREIMDDAVQALGGEAAYADVEPGEPAEVLQSVAKREHGRRIVAARCR